MVWTQRRPGTGSNDHFAEHCRDELCRRLPCQMFKAGHRAGWDEGYEQGLADAPPKIVYVQVPSS